MKSLNPLFSIQNNGLSLKKATEKIFFSDMASPTMCRMTMAGEPNMILISHFPQRLQRNFYNHSVLKLMHRNSQALLSSPFF